MRIGFTIENIDPDLKRQFKAACAHFEISGRAALIKHMQNIVNDYRKSVMNQKISKSYKSIKGKK